LYIFYSLTEPIATDALKNKTSHFVQNGLSGKKAYFIYAGKSESFIITAAIIMKIIVPITVAARPIFCTFLVSARVAMANPQTLINSIIIIVIIPIVIFTPLLSYELF